VEYGRADGYGARVEDWDGEDGGPDVDAGEEDGGGQAQRLRGADCGVHLNEVGGESWCFSSRRDSLRL